MKVQSMIRAVGVVALLGAGVYAVVQTHANIQPAVAASADIQNTLPGWESKDLEDIALQVAANLGDSRPTAIQFVESHRKVAAKFPVHSRVDRDDVSYAVLMHGNFTHEKAFMPPGSKAPTGNTLSIVIRASDGAVTDLALNNQPSSDLGQLGSVADISSN